MRLYFDKEGLDTDKVSAIKIYSSNSRVGVFSFVEQVLFNPMDDFVEVSQQKEVTLSSWFKLSLVDKSGTESSRSEAFVTDSMTRIISAVKANIGDTGGAFSDDEYITKIRESLRIHLGDEYVMSLTESTVGFIVQLVMISCCYDLAFDNARHSKITLPDGISLDKGERVRHYLDIAESLQKRYNTLMGILDDKDNDSAVSISTIKRHTYFKRSF